MPLRRTTTFAAVFLITSLSGCAQRAAVSSDPLCRAALEALPRFYRGGRDCVSVPAGAVLGTKEEASGIAPLLTEARDQYVRYFNEDPPRLLFVVGTSVPDQVRQAVQTSGAVAFNWPTMAGQREAFTKAMKAEVNASFAQAPKRTREAILEKMVKGFEDHISDSGAPSPFEGGTIRHELGHQWFMALYSQSDRKDYLLPAGTSHYGSAAPDWLDEASAILMENDYLTVERRRQFREMAIAAPTVKELTNRRHPVTVRRDDEHAVKQGNITISAHINDRRNERDITQDAAWFYAMTRGFIDFLMARTDDDTIISSISRAIKAGGSFESWLSEYDRRARIGNDMTGLEEAWKGWVKQQQTNR